MGFIRTVSTSSDGADREAAEVRLAEALVLALRRGKAAADLPELLEQHGSPVHVSIAVLDASQDYFVAWRGLAQHPDVVVRAATEARQWREEEAAHCLAAAARSRALAGGPSAAGPLAVALTHAAIPHTAQGGKGVAGAVLLGWAADSVPETCTALTAALAAALAQPLHEALTTTAHAPAPPASPRECLLAAALALGLSKDAPGCRQAGCRQAPQEPRTPARAPGRPQAASFLGGAGAAGGAAAPAGTAGEACAAPGKLDLASAVSLATASDAGWGRRSLDARLLANALLPCELPAPPGSPPGAHSLRHSFDTAFGLDKSRWGGAYPQGPAQSRGSLCWGGAAAGAPPGTTAARPPLAPMRSTSISADGVAPSPFMQPYAPPIEAPQAMSGSLLLPLARGFSAPVSPFEVVAAMRSSCPKSVATHG